MVDSALNIGDIPPIGSSSSVSSKSSKKSDVPMFDNAPNDITFWSFFWKIFIWAVVWICVAALLFAALSAIGWLTSTDSDSVNSMLWILLPVIWFIVSFVGNLALALLYNVFFSKRYYNFWKMFGLIFSSSIIIFIFFFILYFLFNNVRSLYMILWFQIIFGLYISINLMDFLSQPNYSASSLMWNTLWCVLSVVAYIAVMQMNTDISKVVIFMIISSVIAYTIMILWASIWDWIYYKFYEWWNNPFYLPSLNELREERQKEETKKAQDEEEINVDMK